MKFPATIALASLVFTAAGIADPAKWEKSIAAFEQADRDHPPQKGGIVFTGSSTIARWKTLANSFPGFRVVNRCFGGSQMEDSMIFAERILVVHEPAAVVIFAGSNDINAGKSPDVVVGNFKAFVAKVRAALPKTEIRYIEITSSPSRWAQRDKVIEANRLICAFCKEASLLGNAPAVHFITVREKLLGTNGEPREERREGVARPEPPQAGPEHRCLRPADGTPHARSRPSSACFAASPWMRSAASWLCPLPVWRRGIRRASPGFMPA